MLIWVSCKCFIYIFLSLFLSALGFHVNITTPSDAHEKTLKYLTVMAKNVHSQMMYPIWSSLYVHMADHRLTDWLWQKLEGIEQRDKILKYKKEGLKKSDQSHNDYELMKNSEYVRLISFSFK